MQLQMFLKGCRFIPIGSKAVCEFGAIVRLDALNGAGKSFHQMLKEHSGGAGTVFFKNLRKTPAGILINGSILEKLFSDDI